MEQNKLGNVYIFVISNSHRSFIQSFSVISKHKDPTHGRETVSGNLVHVVFERTLVFQ